MMRAPSLTTHTRAWHARAWQRLGVALLMLAVLPLVGLHATPTAAPLSVTAAQPLTNLQSAVEVLPDPGRTLTLADVLSAPVAARFRPSDSSLTSFGFTPSAYWFRFSLDNPSDAPLTLLLILRTAWLDTVDVYVPTAQGYVGLPPLGDAYPFAERRYQQPALVHDLHVPPGRHTYWVRATSAQALMTPIELASPQAFHEADRLWSGYFGLFYGVMAVMVLYNGFLWLATRDRSYCFYCLYLVAFFVMNFAYNGFAFQYFWPDSPRWANWSYALWIYLFQAAGVVFAMQFLESRTRLRRMHRWLKGYLVGLALTAATTGVLGNSWHYNAAAVYGIFIFAPLVVSAGVAAWRDGYTAARFFVLASMATLVGSFITALTASGWLPYTFSTFHAAEFGVMADVVLLALALADRITLLRQQRELAEHNVIDEKLRAHALLEHAKHTLERTVRERTSALARARDDAERLARIDVLTGAYNRRYFEETAAQRVAQAQQAPQALSMILLDIDRFKRINDTHGHGVGDTVIRCVAQTAREALPAGAFIARIGGEEFAILLTDHTQAQACTVAELLRARIAAQQVPAGDDVLRFSASFGVTALGPHDSAHSLLQRADHAMYQSKRGGRNRVTALSAPMPPARPLTA